MSTMAWLSAKKENMPHVKPLLTPEQLPSRYWPTAVTPQSALLQAWQTAPSTGLHATAAHSPSSQAAHDWQLVAPSALAKVPSPHGVHVPEPSLLAAVPLLHERQADALLLPGTGLALPASHARHDALLLEPESGL